MTRTRTPGTAGRGNIIQLNVALVGVAPQVWRRLLIPGTMNLGQLHNAIQAVMGWRNRHLHVFNIGGAAFGNRRSVDHVAAETQVTLNGLLRTGVAEFGYTYDFRDNWEHRIAVEKRERAVEGKSYPACIGGERACPPEDCGGPRGYAELLAILADPKHPKYAGQMGRLGEGFDPGAFGCEQANTILAARFRKKERL